MFREKLLLIFLIFLVTLGCLFWVVTLNYLAYFHHDNVALGIKIGLGFVTAILIFIPCLLLKTRPPFSIYEYQRLPLAEKTGALKKVISTRGSGSDKSRSVSYYFNHQRIQTPPRRLRPRFDQHNRKTVTILIHPQKPFLITNWSYGAFRILAIDDKKAWE